LIEYAEIFKIKELVRNYLEVLTWKLRIQDNSKIGLITGQKKRR
jgi:hypothetical protein